MKGEENMNLNDSGLLSLKDNLENIEPSCYD